MIKPLTIVVALTLCHHQSTVNGMPKTKADKVEAANNKKTAARVAAANVEGRSPSKSKRNSMVRNMSTTSDTEAATLALLGMSGNGR